jgi:hypothetical protein
MFPIFRFIKEFYWDNEDFKKIHRQSVLLNKNYRNINPL